ncbi:MAG: M28 family peptidase [Bacteroidales bacterium]|nr:M28 family peptidase [Bacteroidales bacterium]
MKQLTIFFIFLIASAISYAQDIEYAKSVVQRLASSELHGRGYTEKGNWLAAEFISGEYKRMGLVALDKSYYQQFNISINTFPNALSLKINNEILKPGIDYLIESSSPGIKGKFNVVKCNRKELDTEEKLIGLINKAGTDFILIDNTEQSTDDQEANKKIDDYINFLKYSPQVSSKGIVIYTKEKITWGNATYEGARPVVIINKEMDLKSVQSLEIIIENKFIKNYETQNVVGCIKGSLYPDSFLVVTAHYDHLGQMGKETFFPGANDNASGVAMLLSLADHYSKNQPEYSMLFIALSAEEVGLLGAKAFTEDPLIELSRIKFLVNFDLAGTGEEGVRVVNGSVYKDKFELLTQLNTAHQLLPKIDIRGAACISDHCMFYQKGVPCFYIYTQGGIKAYHDVFDRYETLPLTEFVDYCNLMIRFFDSF